MTFLLTPRNAPTLLDICIKTTSSLLRKGHWHLYGVENPFTFVPSHIIHPIMQQVLEIDGTSKVDILRPLLTSGRITDFELKFVEMGCEEVIEMLRVLSDYASSIRKVSLHLIIRRDQWPLLGLVDTAINDFIHRCSNLQYLTCSDKFNVESINRCTKLKFLEASLTTIESLFVNQVDEKSAAPNNLTHVKMLNCHCRDVTMMLLQCCPNLTVIENDISGALEALHGKEFANGKLRKTYRLRKYHLGSRDRQIRPDYVSNVLRNDIAVRIAAATCPSTTYVIIYTRDNASLAALGTFKCLESLEMEYWHLNSGNVRPGFSTALQKIGKGLNKLHVNKLLVDFGVIGKYCLNLEELSVCYSHSKPVKDPFVGGFSKLKELRLGCGSVESEDLQFLLSNCKALRKLNVYVVECLTDDLLWSLMRKNELSHLEEVYFGACSLTAKGFQTFLGRCPRLKKVMIDSCKFRYEETGMIIREVNPNVRLSNELFYFLNDSPNRSEAGGGDLQLWLPA